jgi:hypothetical protein
MIASLIALGIYSAGWMFATWMYVRASKRIRQRYFDSLNEIRRIYEEAGRS